MNLNLLLVQPDTIWKNVNANLEKCTRLIAKNTQDPSLIILPEMFATGFIMDPVSSVQEEFQQVKGWMVETASEKKATVMGSTPVFEGGRYYNRMLIVKPGGEIYSYNKRHLFAMAGEEKEYAPGKERITFQESGWIIMPQICYDLRFPVWSRNSMNYDILINVANWPAARNMVWEKLLQARAIENQSYVIGVNRVGTDGRDIGYKGNSMIVSATGDILSRLDDQESILEYCIDLENLREFRLKFPVLKDADQFEIK